MIFDIVEVVFVCVVGIGVSPDLFVYVYVSRVIILSKAMGG